MKNIEKTTFSFKNIKYVNLETNEAHLFSNIDRIEIFDSLIFFSDIRGAKKVFCYDFSGNFQGIFGSIGKGEGEYTRLTDFDINTKGNILIYCSPLKKLIEYDSNGKVVSEKLLDFNARAIKCLPGGNILFAMTNSNKKYSTMYTVLNSKCRVEDSFFEFHKNDKADRVRNPYFFETNSGFFSYIPTRNEFFQFSKEGDIQKTIHYNFGGCNPPVNYLHNAFKPDGDFNKGKSYASINKTPSRIGNYLIGEVMLDNSGYSNRESLRYIYLANTISKQVKLSVISEENFSISGAFPYLTTYNDSILISLFEIGQYSLLKDKKNIPTSVSNHVKNDGFTLVLKSELCIE